VKLVQARDHKAAMKSGRRDPRWNYSGSNWRSDLHRCPMKNTYSRITISVLATLYAVTLRGDTVELKTGERLDGTFRQAGTGGVVIEIAGQSMTIPLAKVQTIYLGAAPRIGAITPLPPSRDAIDALKALRSVTEAGVSYMQYAPRMLDAKVRVDKYLSTDNGEGEPGATIRVAMREYELASKAWNASVTNDILAQTTVGKLLTEDPEISKCPAIQQWVRSVESGFRAPRRPSGSRGLLGEPLETEVMWAMIGRKEAAAPLWMCASTKVDEAERTGAVPGVASGVQHEGIGENEAKKPIFVRFSSLPADAEVSIDGQSRGYTPTMDFTDVSAGPHTVAMKKLGYQLWEQTIAFAPGDNRTISADLKPEPTDPTKPRIVGN
jgi:hypothetical protein